jgi:hypothetical protein
MLHVQLLQQLQHAARQKPRQPPPLLQQHVVSAAKQQLQQLWQQGSKVGAQAAQQPCQLRLRLLSALEQTCSGSASEQRSRQIWQWLLHPVVLWTAPKGRQL